jgi:hypothetical protein
MDFDPLAIIQEIFSIVIPSSSKKLKPESCTKGGAPPPLANRFLESFPAPYTKLTSNQTAEELFS